MARTVLGIGTSHSPLLVLGGAQWEFRSKDDRRSKSLNTLDGRLVSYDDLVAERGEPYIKESDPAGFREVRWIEVRAVALAPGSIRRQ